MILLSRRAGSRCAPKAALNPLLNSWLYQREQAARDVLPDEFVGFGFSQPAGAGFMTLDSHHVLDCLSDGVRVAADHGDQPVPTCFGLQDG